VEALLRAAGLPVDGVADHFASFFVAAHDRGLVAAVGLEVYGEHALLRSLVVAAEARGSGLGSTLTKRAIDEARSRGVRTAFLLTTTAEDFFPRFGFQRTARADVPMDVQNSREFQGACPASAIAMRRELADG